LSHKIKLRHRHEFLVSFFNSNKKLQSNFLLELKKETIYWLPWAKTGF